MSSSRSAVAFAVLLGAGLAAQAELKGRVFTDPRRGFRLTIPRDWVQLPLNAAQRDLAGWFESEERYRGDAGKPASALLRVVGVDREGRRDYAHWLLQTLRKDTFKIERSAGTTAEGIPVERWSVAVAVPEEDRWRVIAWVFRGSGEDIAVEFRFPEAHARTLDPAVQRSLESFRFIAKSAAQPDPPDEPRRIPMRDWLRLSLLERHRLRAQDDAMHVERMLASVPKGWSVRKHDDFLLISHVDARTTREVFQVVAAFRAWLARRMRGLSEEYVAKFTVRLCRNRDEVRSYRYGGRYAWYDLHQREIVLDWRPGGIVLGDLLWEVTRRYLMDAVPAAWFNMPTWLRHGLESYVRRARLHGRKLEFPADQEEVLIYDRLRRAKGQRVRTVVELMDDATFGYVPDKSAADGDRVTQALVLLRFFLGPGRRCRALRRGDFVVDYLREVDKLALELDGADPKVLVWDGDEAIALRLAQQAAESGAGSKAPAVPGVEDRWKGYAGIVSKRRPEFLRVLHARVRGWSEAELGEVERGYAGYCRGQER